jgi:hypothetical protein
MLRRRRKHQSHGSVSDEVGLGLWQRATPITMHMFCFPDFSYFYHHGLNAYLPTKYNSLACSWWLTWSLIPDVFSSITYMYYLHCIKQGI